MLETSEVLMTSEVWKDKTRVRRPAQETIILSKNEPAAPTDAFGTVNCFSGAGLP